MSSYIEYVPKRFTADHLVVIHQAESIIREYQRQGYKLTLRQLYYQFVARDWISNTLQSYKRLGGIISDARLAGSLDWEAIEDRTREMEERTRWDNPGEIIRAAANSYHVDYWADQAVRPEVWIEKEALAGVVERVCRTLGVPWFACRGYVSQSAAWEAGQRIIERQSSLGQRTIILHLGDHDPSGIDMTRDIRERISMFAEEPIEVNRLALNMDQVEAFGPPPNPAKLTDSRASDYVARFGYDSWELDALNPETIVDLVREAVEDTITNPDTWEDAHEREVAERDRLLELAREWATA